MTNSVLKAMYAYPDATLIGENRPGEFIVGSLSLQTVVPTLEHCLQLLQLLAGRL